VQIGVEVEVFLHAQIFIEAEFLRHVANTVLDGLRLVGDLDPEDRQRSGGGGHQPRDQADKRRLTGAVGADEGGERAGPHVERYTVERRDGLSGRATKVLMQIARLNRRRRIAGAGHEPPLDEGAVPGAGGKKTVAGMPSRNSSLGSLTKTRIS
jgi:hypothetical protein